MKTNSIQLKKRLIQSVIFFLLLLMAGCAGTKGKSNENWVENQLVSMSIEQKVGQMMVIGFRPKFYNQKNPQFDRFENQIKNYHVGGIVFWKADPY